MIDNKHCLGCRDDFYNGKNQYGIAACWRLEDAQMVKVKEVPIDQTPPWTQAPISKPNCYSRPGFVYVSENTTY